MAARPGNLASAAASSSSSPSCLARLVVVFGQGLGRGRSGGVPGSGGLTSHSSRRRFAARLNSGVRPLVLGTVVAGFWADYGTSLIRSVCISHARKWHRRSHMAQLGFVQTQLRHKYDHPESASCGLAVRVLGRAPGNPASSAASSSPSCLPRLVVLSGQGLGRGAGHRRPNKSFKPMPLRGTA